MQLLVTAAQMQELDRLAIHKHGIPGLTLMENAGQGVVESMEKHLGSLANNQPLVVCGKGNNGGDGFVVTRLLLAKNARPDCILLGKAADLAGDALANYQRLADSGFKVREVSARADIGPLFQNRKVIVDAIFGTGLTRAPAGLAAETIKLINSSGSCVVAIDLPSGLQSDNGVPYDPCVRADLTVTMALPKLGLWLYPGQALAGTIEVVDIGIDTKDDGRSGTKNGTTTPDPKPLSPGADAFLLDSAHVGAILPRRRPDGHKGTFGAALIIAGSRNFSGAAVLAGMAAVRSGCGLIRLAIPAGIADVVSSDVVEAVKIPLPQTETGALSPAAIENLLELAGDAEAVALGPGIGTDRRTQKLELSFLAEVAKPTLIDADGLNNLAGHPRLLSRVKAPLVLTPHPGEFARLTGLKAGDVNADRVGVARKFATEKKVVLVLKGASTVVAAPDGRTFVNPTGNSGLAKGGTGDILSGLIVGLMAQGMSPLDAACAGVFLHGLAADIGVQKLTEYCLAAGDLPRYLPEAYSAILNGDARAPTRQND
ncbi:NAD(P)H-hydrate dehydratase [candidate division WOR-3 bacterium]|nr:NAD(P)H-hydrate dehydratase [candidate division WOR-3 bacterium]